MVEIEGVQTRPPGVTERELHFQPARGDDFLNLSECPILEDEVNPMLTALRPQDLEVSTLHNHWLFARPTILFLHWQKVEPPLDLARQSDAACVALRGS